MNVEKRFPRAVAGLLLAATACTALADGPGEGTRVTAAMARVDPATVSILTIAPADAWQMKAAHGREVLLIDVRSRDEVAFAGAADGVDAVVPFAETAHPVQWDSARGDLARVRVAHFVAHTQAWIAVLGGDHDTPLLLLCRDGDLATDAARALTLAGHINVRPIAGGFEGPLAADGRRHGGWKDSLPWQARVDEERLFGARD